jgi:hypothetical protein
VTSLCFGPIPAKYDAPIPTVPEGTFVSDAGDHLDIEYDFFEVDLLPTPSELDKTLPPGVGTAVEGATELEMAVIPSKDESLIPIASKPFIGASGDHFDIEYDFWDPEVLATTPLLSISAKKPPFDAGGAGFGAATEGLGVTENFTPTAAEFIWSKYDAPMPSEPEPLFNCDPGDHFDIE